MFKLTIIYVLLPSWIPFFVLAKCHVTPIVYWLSHIELPAPYGRNQARPEVQVSTTSTASRRRRYAGRSAGSSQLWRRGSTRSTGWCSNNLLVGGCNRPLWKMMEWVRQLGWWHSQYDGKNWKWSKPPTSLCVKDGDVRVNDGDGESIHWNWGIQKVILPEMGVLYNRGFYMI